MTPAALLQTRLDGKRPARPVAVFVASSAFWPEWPEPWIVVGPGEVVDWRGVLDLDVWVNSDAISQELERVVRDIAAAKPRSLSVAVPGRLFSAVEGGRVEFREVA